MNKILIFSLSVFLTGIMILGAIPYSDAVSYRGKSFADITIENIDGNWDSREQATIRLVDQDANRDSQTAENLTILDAYNSVIEENPAWDSNDMVWQKQGGIISLKVGSPLMLVDSSNYWRSDLATNNVDATLSSVSIPVKTEPSSGILFVTTNSQDTVISNSDSLSITLPFTGTELKNYVSTEPYIFTFLNYDFRSLNTKLSSGQINDFSLVLDDGSNSVNLLTSVNDFQNYLQLSSEQISNIQNLGNSISLKIVFNNVDVNSKYSSETELPLVTDFFTFGFTDDGVQDNERINNAIYRIELLETGIDTDTFEGTMEYLLVNQLTIADSLTYSGLQTIGNSIIFVAGFSEMDDDKSARINYNDLGADGFETGIGDQEPIFFNSIQSDSFYAGVNKINFWILDNDLNTDSNTIEKYSSVVESADPAYNMVGKSGFPEFQYSGVLARILFPTIDGKAWNDDQNNDGQPDCSLSTGIPANLGEMGFEIVETEKNSGNFTGVFESPKEYCDGNTVEYTAQKNMVLNYFDFRDATGSIIEVGGINARTEGYLPTLSSINDIEMTAKSSLGARVDYQLPIFSDVEDEKLGLPSLGVSCSPLSPNEIFPIGITNMTCNAGDNHNNSVSTEFKITILEESTTPSTTTEQTTPSTTTEQTTPSKEPLSFVDESKDPQTYVERYITEPSYKEWFDANYPNYTIYEGIGITEDEYLVMVESLEESDPVETTVVNEPADTKSEEIVVEPELISEIQDLNPSCGTGTKDVNGICVLIESQLKFEPSCGTGTIEKDGICVVDISKSNEEKTQCGKGTYVENGICVVDQNQNAQDPSVPKNDFFDSLIKMFSSWFG